MHDSPTTRSSTQASDRRRIKNARRVRSVQRMSLAAGWNAQKVPTESGEWLSDRLGGLINAQQDTEGVVRFSSLSLVLLELTPTPYSQGSERRCEFYISGGILSRKVDPPGRLGFRLFPEQDTLIVSIHGFSPTLPWWIYANTQARVHLGVMRAFAKHLQKA